MENTNLNNKSNRKTNKKDALGVEQTPKLVSLGVIDMYSPPLKDRYVSTQYEPFGEDNLLPQYFTNLYLNSPLHSGIITKKAEYTAGKNVTVTANDINMQPTVDNFVKRLSCGDIHSLVLVGLQLLL